MTTLETCDRLKPDTTNICTDETPNPSLKHQGKGFATRTIPNSCTCFGYKGAKEYADAICGLLSDGEWELAGKPEHFPKCDPAKI